MLFSLFKWTYRMLARTPLRRAPGMLRLSNVFFRLFWPSKNVIEIQGNKMYVNVNDPSPALRETFQAYGMNLMHEAGTTALFNRIVRPGDVVVDIGANIGYFTLLAAKLVGSTGRVYAFEPEPRNFWYLSKNIEINGYRHAAAFQKAVSDRNGTTQLYVCSYDSGHHTINQYDGIEAYRRGRDSTMRAVDIETISLDAFMREHGGRVDVIKMDVEGAEALALAGMQQTLRSNPGVKLFLEFFPLLLKKMGSSPEAYARSLLVDFGLSAYVVGHDYAMENVDSELTRVDSVDRLMQFLTHEEDHVNLLLCGDPLSGAVAVAR